jgi:hypothetical protein
VLKPGQRCIIINGCKEALGKEVITQHTVGNIPGTPHSDYWLVTGHNIPVQGFQGQGALQDWAYVRDPHLMPIDPDNRFLKNEDQTQQDKMLEMQ